MDQDKGRLQAEVGEVEYRTWLRQMTLAGLDGDEITVNLADTLPARLGLHAIRRPAARTVAGGKLG